MVTKEEKARRKSLARVEAEKRGVSLKPMKVQSVLAGGKNPLQSLIKTEENLSKQRLKNEEKELGLLRKMGGAARRAAKNIGGSAWKRRPKYDKEKEKRQYQAIKGFTGSGVRKFRESANTGGMGLYIGLLLLGILSLIIKNYVSYDPLISLVISVIVGFFFFMSLHNTSASKLKLILVGISFLLDVGLAQGILFYVPESEIKSILITYHVFAWIILSIVLFFVGIFENLGSGEHLGNGTWFSLALIVGVILYLLLPIVVQGPLLNQNESYKEYWEIAQEQIEKVGEAFIESKNTVSDYIGCFTNKMTNPNLDQEECLKQRRILRSCKVVYEDDAEIQECFDQRRQNSDDKAVKQDDSIKGSTEIQFVTGDFFNSEVDPALREPSFTVNLEYKNPNEKEISVDASCRFKSLKGDEFVGKITSKGIFIITDSEGSKRVTCEPESGVKLEGSYELFFEARLQGIETTSDLTRFFIGEKNSDEKKEIINEIKRVEQVNSLNGFAKAKGKGLAWLDFGLGDPAENPIIAKDSDLVLELKLINNGKGKLLGIRTYSVGLDFFEADCKTGSKEIPKSLQLQKIISLTGCNVALPLDLQDVFDYKKKTFDATLEYDYLITKRERIKVKTSAEVGE
jgi:hypothetical protein